MSLKSKLSHILPVADACGILGEPRVTQIVVTLMELFQHNEENPEMIIRSMNFQMKTQSNQKQQEQDSFEDYFSSSSPINAASEDHIPPPIRDAWNKLSGEPWMLDKLTLIRYLVPSCAHPHTGAGGHMGLFDCLAYALQRKSLPSSRSLVPGSPSSAPSLIGIPDIIIFLAICQQYMDYQTQVTDILTVSTNHPAIQNMSRWMFLVYDGYRKNSILKRDTIHRFLSDIYGDNSYKQDDLKTQLDNMFSSTPQLTQLEFVSAIGDSITLSPHPTHFLLDWMVRLASALTPAGTLAESTLQFLETIDHQVRWLPQILSHISLAEHRLYEIKRRFHSLVETSTQVIQGDPMNVEDFPTEKKYVPKLSISSAVFEKTVSLPSDELGHGGYLPKAIAHRVFVAVSHMNLHSGEEHSEEEKKTPFWELSHVLHFGGLCLRSSGDEDLIQLIIGMITHSPKKVNSLTKSQVAELIIMLCHHMDFRSEADRWYGNDDSEHPKDYDTDDLFEYVGLRPAEALGLVPDSWKSEQNGDTRNATISTLVLVDHLMKEVECVDEILTWNQLFKWHKSSPSHENRLNPFIQELRLIATVLFGVPPKMASMEAVLIKEITKRHKSRYPTTDVCRRGPRGTVWYIIDYHWFHRWQRVVEKISGSEDDGNDLRDDKNQVTCPRRLRQISNKQLLRDNGSLALRVDIKWRTEYEILAPLAWSALQAWYDGGPPIHRSVVPYIPSPHTGFRHHVTVNRSVIRTENEIELYPFFVTMFLCDAPSRGEARPFQQGVPVSRVNPVRVLLIQLCKGLDIDPNMGRLWIMETSPYAEESSEEVSESADTTSNMDSEWMLDLEKNISEQRKGRVRGGDQGSNSSDINLLLELKDDESGLWPRGIDGKQWSFQKSNHDSNSNDAIESGDGIVGLYNMGNTCYLNASIQCLSHTPIFREYFNSKCYLNDINTTNPLGHEGHLAQVSALLINGIWKRFNSQHTGPYQHQSKRVTAPGSYALVNAPTLTPKTFKESLGKFNNSFSGNEQHDAQELLQFLLAGLSEDLNRIQDKPYIQAPDSDGRPNHELADIWWANHLQREMSIIVALFTGQYKSLLKCKSCNYESARFEPFSFLQVPLPEDDGIPVSLIVYPLSEHGNEESVKYSVRVHTNGTLCDVLISLAKVLYADETEAKSNADDIDEDGIADLSSKIENDVANQKQLEDEYANRAKNMAVVDMREGYIFKIAPNSWRLSDLQTKDTGELPLLHIYSLDPISEENSKSLNGESNTGGKKNGDDDAQEKISDEADEGKKSEETGKGDTAPNVSFLALSQRRSEWDSKDVLHPLRHTVFGTPLLLRVPYLDSLTGQELYDFVAKRLRAFVPSGALKFLGSSNETSRCSSDEEMAEKVENGTEGPTKVERRQNLEKTFSDMENAAAGDIPRYGFRLRLASRDGRRCSLCPWYACCIGCLVPDDDLPAVAMCGDSITIDWHFAVDVATNGFGIRGSQVDSTKQQSRPRVPGIAVKNHSSCAIGSKKSLVGAITLEDCLDAFAKEERIPEAYCSKCKDFRVQSKRMSLWRLPPVVIIQLKRFQFTQHMRRKLRDFVHFPLEGLDLSRIMAGDDSCSGKLDAKNSDERQGISHNNSNDETEATENGSEGSSCMNEDDGRQEMLYDLYGVVHHQGALSGGHYVASLKSDLDGQWRLFNDAQVYEIHSRDVVDASAYILFYIRRDVKDLNLSDFWDINNQEGSGLTEEEMDNLIHGRSDRCVVS